MDETYEAYRRLKNAVAELSYEDCFAVAWGYSQFTQVKDFAFPSDIERHQSFTADGHSPPYAWQFETLIREIILNASETNTRRKSLRDWRTLAAVVNKLRDLEEQLHKCFVTPDNVLLETLRIAHQQFPWQQRITTRLVGRYYRIFNDPQVDTICRQVIGLPVHKVYAIGTLLWGHYLTSPFLAHPPRVTITGLNQDDFELFFAMAAKDLRVLRQEIARKHPLDDTFSYDNRFTRATPLIKLRKAGHWFVACPFPTILFWRFTSGLYYQLTSESSFFDAIGASFQRYIGDVLRRALPGERFALIPEEKFGPKSRRKDTIDWVVSTADAAIFIECKTKRLSLNAKANLIDRGAFEFDVDILADAIVQTYKTIKDYVADRYPSMNFKRDVAIYPVIVTMENWFPLGFALMGDLQKQVLRKLEANDIDQDVLSDMPYHIASCDEIEEAAQIIAAVGIRAFFDGRKAKIYEGWMIEGYMKHAFKKERKAAVDLFSETYEEILAPFLGH